MPCYKPLKAYRGLRGVVTFDPSQAVSPAMGLPCGRCIGCRLERTRQWAVRIMHESSLHDENCFITLTYDDDNLPSDGSLNVHHFQKFMKRLRARFFEREIRFFHCGEYGEQFQRPHYHACIFGFDFPDKVLYKDASSGKLYTSGVLDSLWPYGFSTVGDVTFESASYVASYCVKKVTGEAADDHYWRLSAHGELTKVSPEYCTMSRRPGIASRWFQKFGNEVYPSDEVIVRGHPAKPPRYYDKLFEAAHGDVESLKSKRKERAAAHAADATERRLADREICARARLSLKARTYEG